MSSNLLKIKTGSKHKPTFVRGHTADMKTPTKSRQVLARNIRFLMNKHELLAIDDIPTGVLDTPKIHELVDAFLKAGDDGRDIILKLAEREALFHDKSA